MAQPMDWRPDPGRPPKDANGVNRTMSLDYSDSMGTDLIWNQMYHEGEVPALLLDRIRNEVERLLCTDQAYTSITTGNFLKTEQGIISFGVFVKAAMHFIFDIMRPLNQAFDERYAGDRPGPYPHDGGQKGSGNQGDGHPPAGSGPGDGNFRTTAGGLGMIHYNGHLSGDFGKTMCLLVKSLDELDMMEHAIVVDEQELRQLIEQQLIDDNEEAARKEAIKQRKVELKRERIVNKIDGSMRYLYQTTGAPVKDMPKKTGFRIFDPKENNREYFQLLQDKEDAARTAALRSSLAGNPSTSADARRSLFTSTNPSGVQPGTSAGTVPSMSRDSSPGAPGVFSASDSNADYFRLMGKTRKPTPRSGKINISAAQVQPAAQEPGKPVTPPAQAIASAYPVSPKLATALKGLSAQKQVTPAQLAECVGLLTELQKASDESQHGEEEKREQKQQEFREFHRQFEIFRRQQEGKGKGKEYEERGPPAKRGRYGSGGGAYAAEISSGTPSPIIMSA